MGAAPVAQSSQSVESGHMHACWGVWHLHAPSHARARAPAELSSRDLCQVPNRSRRPRGPVPLRDCVLSRGLWRVAMPVVVVLGRQVGGVVGRVLEVGGGGPMTRSQQRREKRGKKKKKARPTLRQCQAAGTRKPAGVSGFPPTRDTEPSRYGRPQVRLRSARDVVSQALSAGRQRRRRMKKLAGGLEGWLAGLGWAVLSSVWYRDAGSGSP
jgi:hypothetical protein